MGDKGRGLGWGRLAEQKRPRSSCSCSRNLRRVFSQTQMWEKNRGPRLAEMTRLQMKEREIESPYIVQVFHLEDGK